MTEREPTKLIEIVVDKTASAMHRAEAAGRLAELEAEGALTALIEVAHDLEVDSALSSAVGDALARLLIRRGELDRVLLEDFTGAAYLAYDEAVSRHLLRPTVRRHGVDAKGEA